MIGVKTLNGDIIYEKGGFFNVYFRQNAKLCKMADGHLFFCAKHTKTGCGNWQRYSKGRSKEHA
jgi:hypothetical protein